MAGHYLELWGFCDLAGLSYAICRSGSRYSRFDAGGVPTSWTHGATNNGPRTATLSHIRGLGDAYSDPRSSALRPFEVD